MEELETAKATITTLEAGAAQADAREAAMQQILAENEAARQQDRALIRVRAEMWCTYEMCACPISSPACLHLLSLYRGLCVHECTSLIRF